MTQSRRWAGLLRAVNVGGRTLTMATLKASAAEAGLTEVATLLASGNIVFTATGSQSAVRGRLERAILIGSGLRVEVLLRSKPQLKRLLDANPFPDGNGSRVVVNFLDGAAPGGLAERLSALAVHERIVVAGSEVWVDFVDGIGRSKLAVKLPAAVKPMLVTGRNLNTVTKLLDRL